MSQNFQRGIRHRDPSKKNYDSSSFFWGCWLVENKRPQKSKKHLGKQTGLPVLSTQTGPNSSLVWGPEIWRAGCRGRGRHLPAHPASALHLPGPGEADSEKNSPASGDRALSRGCGGKNGMLWLWLRLNRRGKPRVLVHVSTYQGNPFWYRFFEPHPYGLLFGFSC